MLQIKCLFGEVTGVGVEPGLVVGDVGITEIVGPDKAETGPEHGEEFLGTEVVRIENETLAESRPD